ncbi:hypothetical protein JW868_03210 [Candidatus Woesearchaeota archaeon]|nr:hypothetical protein [Candidatus Woesearchaeota archaeon]
MKVVNTPFEDNHIHSINYSDGMSTVDAIVEHAVRLGRTKITITDHSDAAVERTNMRCLTWRGFSRGRYKTPSHIKGLEVRFGVEADLLNAEGDVSAMIGEVEYDKFAPDQKPEFTEEPFVILSLHTPYVYGRNLSEANQGFANALARYGSQIHCIGHIYLKAYGSGFDPLKVVEAANAERIPIELNTFYMNGNAVDPGLLREVMQTADQIMVNTDSHTLHDMEALESGFTYLESLGLYLPQDYEQNLEIPGQD